MKLFGRGWDHYVYLVLVVGLMVGIIYGLIHAGKALPFAATIATTLMVIIIAITCRDEAQRIKSHLKYNKLIKVNNFTYIHYGSGCYIVMFTKSWAVFKDRLTYEEGLGQPAFFETLQEAKEYINSGKYRELETEV